MYLKLFNKADSSKTIIVDEYSDFLFDEGWRMLASLKWISGEDYLQLQETKRQISIRQCGF